jgi:LmbE family N-acetylglucosaminyl deacetylase
MNYLISPHNDDETLFAAYTVQREKCAVVVVFDSHVQVARGHPECTWEVRRAETEAALKELGAPPPIFLGYSDCQKATEQFENKLADDLARRFQHVPPDTKFWIPKQETGAHDHHNVVAWASETALYPRVTDRYLTYSAGQKSRDGIPVDFELPWVARKLRALACYKTQIEIAELGCWSHFMADQYEFYAHRR